MFLNNWHQLMVKNILQYGQSWYFWYFLFLLFICNYFVIATLMSSVTEVLEEHAKSVLMEEAQAHKRFMDHIEYCRKKMQKYHYFQLFKKNTIDIDSGAHNITSGEDGVGMKKGRGEMKIELEDAPPSSWFQAEYIRRQKWSFYLFPPIERLMPTEDLEDDDDPDKQENFGGDIQKYMKRSVTSMKFNGGSIKGTTSRGSVGSFGQVDPSTKRRDSQSAFMSSKATNASTKAKTRSKRAQATINAAASRRRSSTMNADSQVMSRNVLIAEQDGVDLSVIAAAQKTATLHKKMTWSEEATEMYFTIKEKSLGFDDDDRDLNFEAAGGGGSIRYVCKRILDAPLFTVGMTICLFYACTVALTDGDPTATGWR
jgi:hypothetical protein